MPAVTIDGSGAEALLSGAVFSRTRFAAPSARAARRAVHPLIPDMIATPDPLLGSAEVPVIAYRYDGASTWQELGGFAGLGPDGFAQGGAGDGMAPGPLLEVLTEQAVTGSPRLHPFPAAGPRPAADREVSADAAAAAAASAAAGDGPLAGIPGIPGAAGVRDLTADELLGVMSAARRLQYRAEWLELSAIAELARRRHAEKDAATARGVFDGQRPGQFAADEISFQLTCSGHAAGERLELADALAARLPACCSRIAVGAIGSYQALIIHRATRDLSPEHAAIADAILAEEAPALNPGALRRRAARVAMTLDPEAAAKRKKAGAEHKRVEMWPEDSGNAAIACREMDPADALAASSYYDALARALRQAGVPGSLRELRHLAFTDLNTGRDPLARACGSTSISAADGGDAGSGPGPGGPEGIPPDMLRDDGVREDEPGYDPWSSDGEHDPDNGEPGSPGSDGGPGPAAPPDAGAPSGGAAAPFPANITITVSAGTLLGWSSAPGDVPGLGPVDAPAARDLVKAASRHPRTRWCVTVTGPDGTAVGHGCAPGRHAWPPAETTATASPADRGTRAAWLLDWLGVAPEPVARGSCDHRHAEDRYTPSRKLAHLIRARTTACPAIGCEARAEHNDLDHTIAWPEGPTDECNLSPPCRHHHRVKQAPGWSLEQESPGNLRWTAPSGRTYTAGPTVYPADDEGPGCPESRA